MNKLICKYNLIERMELAFLTSYFLLAVCTFNSFLFGKPIMSVLVAISFVLGCILVVERVVHWKVYIKMPYILLLIVFCISLFVTTILNWKYGWLENFKWLIWTSFQILILYGKRIDENEKKYRKQAVFLGKMIIFYSFIAAVISLVLLVIGYSKINFLEANGQRYITGFIWGRLWGTYTDPNYGATIGVVSIILSLYFIQKGKTVLRKFYMVNCVLQLLYIVFSDSRTGFVALIIALAFYVYCNLRERESSVVSWKSHIKNVLISIMVCVLVFAGMQAIKVSYNKWVAPALQTMFQPVDNGLDEEESIEIGREEDIKNDPSNRRFDIWGSGLEIFGTSPLFGTGYVSFVPYTEEHLPHTYVLENDHGVFASMHNSFLNVLVFQGLFGFIPFILFAILAAVKIVKSVWGLKGEQYYFAIALLSCIGAVVCSMMFLLEGVYTNSIGCIVLWQFMGVLVHLSARARKDA